MSTAPWLVVMAALLGQAPSGHAPAVDVAAWGSAWDDDDRMAAPPQIPADLDFAPTSSPLERRRGGDRRVLWLRATVDGSAWADPVLFVPKAFVGFAAYVNGEKVLEEADYDRASGTPTYTIPLPRAGGRHSVASPEVTLRVYSLYTKVGLPEGARVGAARDILTGVLRADAPRLALASLLGWIGLVALLLAVRSREGRGLFMLAVLALAAAVWTAFHTKSKLLLVDEPALWFRAWWLSVPLMCLGHAGFVAATFGAQARVLPWLFRGCAVIAALAAVPLVVDVPYEAVGLPFMSAVRVLALLFYVAAAVALLVLAVRGDGDARVYLAGFAVSATASMHDLALGLSLIGGSDTLGHYGFFALVVSLILILRRRFVSLQRQNEAFARQREAHTRERDRMMRDLHDGLGGLVSNVRLLADRARARSPHAEAAPLLDNIASLSGEALAELRTLVAGLDELPADWNAVAADLRRAASSALEPHGVTLLFAASVDDAAGPPSSTVYVNLLRVFRESLANVAKHARAHQVEVHFAVRPRELVLEVVDDGVGRAGAARDGPAAAGGGRGLPSMGARAHELGGELALSDVVASPGGPVGTRLRLRLPLSGSPPPDRGG